MKVTVLLKNEHEALKALFNKLKKPSSMSNPNMRTDLFNQIQRELSIHSRLELEIFYPTLITVSSPRAAELVAKAEQDHDSIDRLLHELSGMSGSEKTFEAKAAVLMDEVTRHIDMEEEEIFEEARKNLPEYRLEELGLEMEDRRKVLVTLAA
jgi:hemerythrin-like domain-containing protein